MAKCSSASWLRVRGVTLMMHWSSSRWRHWHVVCYGSQAGLVETVVIGTMCEVMRAVKGVTWWRVTRHTARMSVIRSVAWNCFFSDFWCVIVFRLLFIHWLGEFDVVYYVVVELILLCCIDNVVVHIGDIWMMIIFGYVTCYGESCIMCASFGLVLVCSSPMVWI